MKVEEIKKYQEMNDCPVPNGTLMIIGGGQERDVVIKEFISLIKQENPVIELITTAGSEDVEGTYREYKSFLRNSPIVPLTTSIMTNASLSIKKNRKPD